jgi:hypothetical protein
MYGVQYTACIQDLYVTVCTVYSYIFSGQVTLRLFPRYLDFSFFLSFFFYILFYFIFFSLGKKDYYVT